MGVNDFFHLYIAELREHDPRMHALMNPFGARLGD